MENVYVPSTWRRLFAYGIDQIFVLVFYIPFAKTFLQIFTTDEDIYISLGKLILMFLVPAIYEFIFLLILSATPGKWLLGLRVVPAHNAYGELHFAQCLLRPLVGRLSFFFAWAIYAVAFFRYDRTHLVDWLAETRVIQLTPRVQRPHLRWFLGSVLVVGYLYEGLLYSHQVINSIDWGNKRVELRSLLGADQMDMMDFDFDDND